MIWHIKEYMDSPCAWQYPAGFLSVSIKLESEHNKLLRPNISGSIKNVTTRIYIYQLLHNVHICVSYNTCSYTVVM